jgi:CCR4-NOT transcription complex subunit 7/8
MTSGIRFNNISGIILNDQVYWICFHGCYDFAYFLRILLDIDLPTNKEDFDKELSLYFNNIYDIKSFPENLEVTDTGLNRLAENLGVSISL